MRLDLITKLAKRGLTKPSDTSFFRSYITLLTKPRTLQKTPQIYPNHVLPKSMYSSSTQLPDKKGFIGWYLRMLEVRPIVTKAVSSSLIYAAADVTSQMITVQASGSIDFVRTTRIASFGLLILGPSQHFWFTFVGNALPKRDVASTLKKIAMGQLIFGPIINSIFFSYNAGLQGENGHQIISRLKRDLLPTLMGGLMYWPLCDFLTFKIIPVGLQPLVNSSFAYLWSIYLTYMAGLEKAE